MLIIKMSSKLCCFHTIVKGDCGASRGLETLCLLRDSNDDIGGHLINCHLSTESLTETGLILGEVLPWEALDEKMDLRV